MACVIGQKNHKNDTSIVDAGGETQEHCLIDGLATESPTGVPPQFLTARPSFRDNIFWKTSKIDNEKEADIESSAISVIGRCRWRSVLALCLYFGLLVLLRGCF